MGKFHKQEELGESVVFELNALSEPSSGNAKQLREKPWLVCAIVVAEILFESEFCKKKSNFIGPAAFQIVECMDARFPND